MMYSVASVHDARSAGVTAWARLLSPPETSAQRKHASAPAIVEPLRRPARRAAPRRPGACRPARRAGIRFDVTWTNPFAVAGTIP